MQRLFLAAGEREGLEEMPGINFNLVSHFNGLIRGDKSPALDPFVEGMNLGTGTESESGYTPV